MTRIFLIVLAFLPACGPGCGFDFVPTPEAEAIIKGTVDDVPEELRSRASGRRCQ